MDMTVRPSSGREKATLTGGKSGHGSVAYLAQCHPNLAAGAMPSAVEKQSSLVFVIRSAKAFQHAILPLPQVLLELFHDFGSVGGEAVLFSGILV